MKQVYEVKKNIHAKIKYCNVEEEISEAEGVRRGNYIQPLQEDACW